MKEGLLPTDAVSVCKSFPVELSDSEGGGCEGRGEAPGHPLLLHTRPDTRHQGDQGRQGAVLILTLWS